MLLVFFKQYYFYIYNHYSKLTKQFVALFTLKLQNYTKNG